MIRFLLRRLISAIILMFIASIFSFLLINAFPGDIAPLIAELRGGFVSQEIVDQVAEEYGLNDPVVERYFRWLSDLADGNLGYSFRTGEEVSVELKNRLLPTLTFVGFGGLLAILIAVVLSFCGAFWPGSFIDKFTRGFALTSISIPKFFMAAMLIYFFGVILDLVPTFGFRGPSSWILPAVTIGLVSGSKQSRLARVKLEETMTRPYVLTAMSKGFGRERILFRDALPNIVPIVLTSFGMDLGFMAQAALIVEPIFSWHGIGAYFVESVRFRDLAVLQSCLLIFSIIFINVNLLVDIIVMLVNPLQRRPKAI